MLVEDILPRDLDIDADRFPSWRVGQYGLFMDTLECLTRFSGHCAPCGCHRKGQELLSYDGRLIKVEDIRVGDKLMGPDSKPRYVKKLIRGRGQMYSVNPIKGESWIVNEDHILTLTTYGANAKVNDISVKEYIQTKWNYKWKRKLFRAPVDCWPARKNLPLDPYFLGVLIGDGALTHGVQVHKPDREIHDTLKLQASLFDLIARPLRRKGIKGIVGYALSLKADNGWDRGSSGRESNPITVILRAMGLCVKSETKFVPFEYKVSSVEQRLEILAGLMDTDGSNYGSGYDFISKSKQLADDVAFLARSVGLAAFVKECEKGCQNDFTGTYHRVGISGDCRVIPCRIARKKIHSERKQVKNVLRTAFELEKLGFEDFYGFELDVDGRYLLGDFTVTHNSGKTLAMVANARAAGGRTLILTPFKGLQTQITSEFDFVTDLRGKSNYACRLLGTNCEIGAPRCGMRKSTMGTGLCDHKAATDRASKAEIVVMNYSCWFHQMNAQGIGKFDTIICDEADAADGALSEHLAFTLTSKEVLGELHMSRSPHWDESLHIWIDWGKSVLGKLTILADEAEEDAKKIDDPYILERFFHLRNLHRKISTLASMFGDDWIAETVRDGIRFDPIWPGRFAEKYLFRGIPRVLLFSGTLNEKTFGLLGVRKTDRTFYVSVTVPSLLESADPGSGRIVQLSNRA